MYTTINVLELGLLTKVNKSIKLVFLMAVLQNKMCVVPTECHARFTIISKWQPGCTVVRPKNFISSLLTILLPIYVSHVLKSEANGFVTLGPHCTMLGYISFCFLPSLSRLCSSSPQSDAQVKLLLLFPVAIFPRANALHQWLQGELDSIFYHF